MAQQLQFTISFIATFFTGLIVASALHSLFDHLKPRLIGWFKRRIYRIAIVKTKSALGDDVTWYAIQRRSSVFRWHTVSYANDIVTARVSVRSIMNRPHEKVINVVSLEKKARKAK